MFFVLKAGGMVYAGFRFFPKKKLQHPDLAASHNYSIALTLQDQQRQYWK
jgi:hypothetical protein